MKVPIVQGILSANDQIAAQNRRLLDDHRISVMNIMASPGAGKTSLILRTIESLRGRLRVGVIEGDIASSIDADRVATQVVPVVQINTGGQCHLDGTMIQRALQQLPLSEVDLLIVENVGNLICPVEFRLGEDWNVVVTSTPEGDDKPYKYPGIFTAVDAIVINKVDLLPYLKFDIAAFRKLVSGMNTGAALFEVSCETGQGVEEWAQWIFQKHQQKLQKNPSPGT